MNRPAFHVIHINRRFLRSVARNMAAAGIRRHAILGTLRVTAARLEQMLAGNTVWDGAALAQIRAEAERA